MFLFTDSAVATAARKAAYVDCVCTCWRCKPMPENMALGDCDLPLWEMDLEVEIVTMYDETIKVLMRKDSKECESDKGEEK